MQPREYRCECGHLAAQHADDEHERCTVERCACEFFLHDHESWHALAAWMSGRSEEFIGAVRRSLDA